MGLSEKKRQQILGDLAPVLVPGESIEEATTGMIKVRRMGTNTERNGTIAVTDRRLVLFTKKVGGYDMQDFAYAMIASVDHKRGMMGGNLTINAAGDQTHVSMVPKDDIETIAHAIREKVNASRSGPAAVVAPLDPMDQLKKLAELRDAGVISSDEFDAKKKQLLGL